MIKGENIEFLSQLASSLEKAELKLEDAYKGQRFDEFDKLKKFILEIQRKISEAIE